MAAATPVTNDTTPEFDLGPLSWVQAEIDEALNRGLEALAAFRAASHDTTAIKHARTHVHQAAGAIQMVGLDAVVAFTDEIERQLARLDELSAADAVAACDVIDRACRKLRIFLDDLVNGAPPVSLKLFPEYEAMQRARGVRAAAPTDLFYPELGERAPKSSGARALAAAKLPSYLVKQRRQYQRGLLAWLRGEEEGARQMRDALAGIEEATGQANLRAFWWTAGALLDAVAEHGLDASFGVKQLAARIDLQIRRVVEGSAKVADRLRREVLYYVAISAPVALSIEAVQQAFRLDGLIPSAEVLNADLVRMQPHLREGREQLGHAKESWLKFTSGRAENLPKLKQMLASVHTHAADVGHGALMKLTAALVARLERMPAGNVPDPVAMEYATALLLAENAFANFASLSPEFPKQVDVMLARLDAAQASRPFEGGAAAPMLEEMSKRAQERVLLAQVAREIQANLRHMEQVLDGFFRDHGKRSELASLARDSSQIRGALRMLGLSAAEELLASCQDQIALYADPATEIPDEDLELLAESLSGLGFYIEAVEQQRADHERLIAPLLARRRGEVPAPMADAGADSVEAAVEELRNALPELVAEIHRAPADDVARDALKAKLAVLRDDAELIGDADLATQAKAALRELEQGGTAAVAITAIAESGSAAPAPEVSAETQRLLDSGDHALDAELLEIFLTEAAEVLDTVAEHHRILRHNPGDREALRTVRRQFHTLKGSGRMVGLLELGEIAYDVEQMHNRLLEEDRPVTPGVLAMIAAAEAQFRQWVAALGTAGRVRPDPARVHQAILAVEAELPGRRESILKSRSAATAATKHEPCAPAPVQIAPPTAVPDEATAEVVATASDALPWPAPVIAAAEALVISTPLAAESVDGTGSSAQEQAPSGPGEAVIEPFGGALDDTVAREYHLEILAQNEATAGVEEVPEEHLDAPEDLPERRPTLPVMPPLTWDLIDLPELGDGQLEMAPADLVFGAVPSPVDDESEIPLITLDLIATPVGDGESDLPPRNAMGEEQKRERQPIEEIVVGAPPSYPPRLSLVPPLVGPPSIVHAPLEAAPPEDDALAASALDDQQVLRDSASGVARGEHWHDTRAGSNGAEEVLTLDWHTGDTPLPASDGASSPPSSDATESATAVMGEESGLDVGLDALISEERNAGAAFAEAAATDADTSLASAMEADSPDQPAAAEPPAEEITVGGVTLSRSLYDILTAEADEHLATLSHELSLLQLDPSQPLSAAMVRASHTLCGIHRAGGFPLVAITAKALEQCLLSLQQRLRPVPSAAQPILARAIAGLAMLVATVKAQAAFTGADAAEAEEIQRELDHLRQEAMQQPITSDSPPGDLTEEVGEHALAEAPVGAQLVPENAAAGIDVGARESPLALVAQSPPAPAAREEMPAAVPIDVETPLEEIRDDVDTQLLPIFLEEAEELFPQAAEQLRAWGRNAADTNHPGGLRRTLHTFKGSARMAGAMRLGELTHRMEARLVCGEELAPGTPELFDALDADLDRVAFVLDALREGRTDVVMPELAATPSAPHLPAAATADERAAIPAAALPGIGAPALIAPVVILLPVGPAAPGIDRALLTETAEALPAAAEFDAGQRAMLRVRADIIDRLVNEAGEVAIARARIEGELRALKSNLLELTTSVIRMRAQVREIEIQAESQINSRFHLRQETNADFDPLEFDRYTRFQELTRSLAEGVNDVSTVQQALLRNVDDADAALVAQARLSRDVQQQLFSIRTVPFGSLSERLYRILRQVAKELDKRVNLDIRGSQVELDRSVLEKLVGPLEHLLRNALDHGIESRDARVKAGKPAAGEIVVAVRQIGNEIAIELIDDGAGLDLERIRARAVAQGRIAAAAKPTPAQLIECIFQPGFSTAARVTAVSGRGIGMDVVRTEIAALGGRVEVSTRPGLGTTFLLYLPLTLAVAQAVLVRAGGRLWALPAPMVEQVQQVKAEALHDLYAKRQVLWQGVAYPFHYLPRLLGDTQSCPLTGRFNAVLLLRTGQGVAAMHVDEMIGNQEVVVKNIGPQLARVSGIAGATVLGTGEIVLIINPVQLAQRGDAPGFHPDADERVVQASREAAAGPPLVMVVDDSLTVRKITSRLLVREGFEVATAKDGMDALQLLEGQARLPDVILLDIEMPRMDGFEFTRTIKADARHAHIPIIVITSRTAEKHRNRAKELGVDLYIGKPYQEEELLRYLREMLSVTA